MIRGILVVSLIGFLAWAYHTTVPPPPKICGSPGGPPITGPRIKLRDGRHLAYVEHGLPKHLAKHKIVFFHGFGSCRHDVVIAENLSQVLQLVPSLVIMILKFSFVQIQNVFVNFDDALYFHFRKLLRNLGYTLCRLTEQGMVRVIRIRSEPLRVWRWIQKSLLISWDLDPSFMWLGILWEVIQFGAASDTSPTGNNNTFRFLSYNVL